MSRNLKILTVLLYSLLLLVSIDAVSADCKTDFNTAKASYEGGNYERAASDFRAVVQAYKDCALAPEALYMIGQSLEKLGRTDKAIDAYSVLISYRPDSSFARKAQERIKSLKPSMTQKDIEASAQSAIKAEPQLGSLQSMKKTILGIDGSTFWSAVGAIVTIFAFLIGWYLSRRKKRSVSKFMTDIDDTYSSFKMKSRRCEAELYRMKDLISDELKKGKIDESAFSILDKRIDDYLREIREQIVNEKFGGLPSSMKAELNKMLKDEEITEEEYTKFEALLRKTGEMEDDEKKELGKMVRKWREEDRKR